MEQNPVDQKDKKTITARTRSGYRLLGIRAALPPNATSRLSVNLPSSTLAELMLDEVDYGMLLIDHAGKLLYANAEAKLVLNSDHPLQVVDLELRARLPQDVQPLNNALQRALRGVRKVVTLGSRTDSVSVAFVPLGAWQLSNYIPEATLLVLGRRRVCSPLSVQFFARAHSLTLAETRVLEELCGDSDRVEIASRLRIEQSTLRSHISSILARTDSRDRADLMRKLANFAPMVSHLPFKSAADDSRHPVSNERPELRRARRSRSKGDSFAITQADRKLVDDMHQDALDLHRQLGETLERIALRPLADPRTFVTELGRPE